MVKKLREIIVQRCFAMSTTRMFLENKTGALRFAVFIEQSVEIEQRTPGQIVFQLVCVAFVASGQDLGTHSEGARSAIG